MKNNEKGDKSRNVTSFLEISKVDLLSNIMQAKL